MDRNASLLRTELLVGIIGPDFFWSNRHEAATLGASAAAQNLQNHTAWTGVKP